MYTIDNASMCQEASNVLFDDDKVIIVHEQHDRWAGGGHPSGCSKYDWVDHANFNPLDPDSDNGYYHGCNKVNYPCVCASFPVSFFVLTVLAS